MIVTKNLDSMIDKLRKAGASFRGEIAEAGADGKSCFKIHREMSSSVRIRRTFEMTGDNTCIAARSARPFDA